MPYEEISEERGKDVLRALLRFGGEESEILCNGADYFGIRSQLERYYLGIIHVMEQGLFGKHVEQPAEHAVAGPAMFHA